MGKSPSLYGRIFWPVLAPSILFGIASGATVPVQILAAIELGASPSLAALIVAVVGAIGLATTVQAGGLIDRVGERLAMLLATLAAATMTGVVVVALIWGGHGALGVFMAATFLQAPAMNVWSLARQAFTADHVATHEVGRAMTTLGGTMRIGNLVGPLLGGLLLLWLPLWSAYALSVACALAAVTILFNSPLLGVPAAGPQADSGPASATAVADPPSAGFDWTRVVLAGIAISALAVARAGQPVVVQLWGIHLGMDASAIALLVALGAAVEIVCMFPGGYLKDRLGRSPILIICLVIYGAGFLLMVPSSHWWAVAGMTGAVVVMAVGNGLGAGVNMTIGADLSPTVGRGRFLGVWALFSNVGQFGGPLLISALMAVSTVAVAVSSIGGIALAGAVWMALGHRRMALPRGVERW